MTNWWYQSYHHKFLLMLAGLQLRFSYSVNLWKVEKEVGSGESIICQDSQTKSTTMAWRKKCKKVQLRHFLILRPILPSKPSAIQNTIYRPSICHVLLNLIPRILLCFWKIPNYWKRPVALQLKHWMDTQFSYPKVVDKLKLEPWEFSHSSNQIHSPTAVEHLDFLTPFIT